MRLIDADKLKRKAQKIATDAWRMKLKGNVETILNQFIDWIDASQTIEIPERKTGKWIRKRLSINCSVCKKCNWSLCFEDVVRQFNYCPHCGAMMEGEQE